MKLYKEIVKKTQEVADIFCNGCGNQIKTTERGEMYYSKWSCEMVIESVCHGSFPGQHDETVRYDICQTCYKDKIKPLLEVMPPNVRHYDQDSNTTTITP